MIGWIGLRGRAVLLFLCCGFASACATAAPSHRSALQKSIGEDGIGATELRLRLYELPLQLGSWIEGAADRIRAESSDPAVRRRALLWKADGIPALFAAALRPDPLAGAIDLWLLVEQMDLYFREGAGKDAFGPQQPIADAAVARMRAAVEDTAASMTTRPEVLERRSNRIEVFARAHPIEGAFSARDTALIELARLYESGEGGAFASVGEATETLSDIALRLNAYVLLMPKVARWQVELAMEEMTGRDSLHDTLEDLRAVGDAARLANGLLADLPASVRDATRPVQELLQSTTALITAEREAVLAGLSEERKAVLESVREERVAVQEGIDALVERSLQDATERTHRLVDYILVRALILVAASVAMSVVGYRFAVGRRYHDEGSTPTGAR